MLVKTLAIEIGCGITADLVPSLSIVHPKSHFQIQTLPVSGVFHLQQKGLTRPHST